VAPPGREAEARQVTRPGYVRRQPSRCRLEAYKRVKSNKGAAGVDGCSIEDFEKDLKNNLYKVWNRMSSGTYFPPPVKVSTASEF
jgi:retron-type reverse transcriptase